MQALVQNGKLFGIMFLCWDWNFIIYVWDIKQYCVAIKIIFSKPLMTFISTYSGKIARNRRWSHIALDDSTKVLKDSFQVVFINF